MPLLGPWKWLDELRFRFDLAVELVDRSLEFVMSAAAEGRRGLDIRRALSGARDPAFREAATAVLRTAKARSLSIDGLRLRIIPLFAGSAVPRAIAGLLLLGQPVTDERLMTHAEEIDRRLDEAGQWLSGAIEASIETSLESAAQARASQRLQTILDVGELLCRSPDHRHLIRLTVHALAFWYDADVRAYRRELGDGFVLDTSLPGLAGARRSPERLPAAPISERDEVFRPESPRELEELEWDARLANTLFAPILIGDSPDWLLTVSGSSDSDLPATLVFMQRTLGRLITALEAEAGNRLRDRLDGVLTTSDRPFDTTTRLALETVAHEIGASGARLGVLTDRDDLVLSIGWGHLVQGIAAAEPGRDLTTPRRIGVSAPVGAGVTAVAEFLRPDGAFTTATVRLVRSATQMIAIWLAGALLARADDGADWPRDPGSVF